MKTNFETLELNTIQIQLNNYCASTLAKNKIKHLSIYKDKEKLENELLKVKDTMRCIEYYGRLPLGGLIDITQLLKKAAIDAVLTGEELYQVYNHLCCIENVNQYHETIEFDVHYIEELFTGLMMHHGLYQQIKKCILPDGTVSDHASETLYKIRKEMNSTQYRIRKKMESIIKESKDSLSIDTLTTRNDRLVLPVKAGYKNQFGGLVHAHSATGQTVYIEPEAVMSMNNRMNELKIEEQEEINRILTQLSNMVKSFNVQFEFNQRFLGELDFLFAKGQFGVYYHCCIAEIDDEFERFYIQDARHPLIDQSQVVANTILLNEQKMLLITGSNTGGKSVLLKTAGLLSLMTLCGLPIPANQAMIPFFDDVLVDLGDEQSIEQSLSTFSSHMKKMIHILETSTHQSLIIVDEIGSGTDPDEGESLAQAILQQLLKKDCFVLSSTHFGGLKAFAKANEKIAVGSVSFDHDSLKPTYHLQMDMVGQSYAFEIALRLGLNQKIVDQAILVKKEKMTEAEILLEKLEKEKEIILQKEEKLNEVLKENKKLNDKYNHRLEVLEKQKERMLEEAKLEANLIIDETKEKIDVIVNDLKKSSLKDHQIIDAKTQIKQMKYIDEKDNFKQDHDLQVGDHVRVMKMNREGDVVEILNKNMIMVDLSGLKIKLHEDEVQYMHPKTKIKKVEAGKKTISMKKTSSYELNVIGKRYEEAMAIVDKFLDDAIVLGYPHVRIIHGMGTGVLRKGIRKMLDKNKNVVSYRDGGPNEGGLGATLVYFEK